MFCCPLYDVSGISDSWVSTPVNEKPQDVYRSVFSSLDSVSDQLRTQLYAMSYPWFHHKDFRSDVPCKFCAWNLIPRFRSKLWHMRRRSLTPPFPNRKFTYTFLLYFPLLSPLWTSRSFRSSDFGLRPPWNTQELAQLLWLIITPFPALQKPFIIKAR